MKNNREEIEKSLTEELDLLSETDSEDSDSEIKVSYVDNQLNSIDWFAFIESNKEWVENYLFGIDCYIKRIISRLSYYRLNDGLIISLNSDFLKLLEEKQEHTKALMNDLDKIVSMLDEGTCFDDNGILPLGDKCEDFNMC